MAEYDRVIMTRKLREVNTDPQRRCYYGVHAKSEWQWSAWEVLEYTTRENEEARLKFWRELNDYAVSARGKSAKSEFKVEDRELCE